MAAARQLQLGDDERPDPGEVADREVDLAEQEHEDDAEREHRGAGRLVDQVDEVDGGEEVRRREPEDDDDEDLADDDRRRAEVAGAQVQPGPLPEPREPASGAAPPRAAGARSGPTTSAVLTWPPPAVDGMPDTFVG